MPVLNGFDAAKRIRELEDREKSSSSSVVPSTRLSIRLNGRIPIFAVSASLQERQRTEMMEYGMDGWILKPVEFKRLRIILKGILDPTQREQDVYRVGCSWEAGGWLDDRAISDAAKPLTPP